MRKSSKFSLLRSRNLQKFVIFRLRNIFQQFTIIKIVVVSFSIILSALLENDKMILISDVKSAFSVPHFVSRSKTQSLKEMELRHLLSFILTIFALCFHRVIPHPSPAATLWHLKVVAAHPCPCVDPASTLPTYSTGHRCTRARHSTPARGPCCQTT